MKNSRICPKCQSVNIVRIDGYAGAYGAGNNVNYILIEDNYEINIDL